MKIMEALCLNLPRAAIDIIVNHHRAELAESVGMRPVEQSNEIVKLMSHRTYQRVGRRVRRREGKVIA